MKEMIRYGITLALICIVASGLLATANSLTKSKILLQAQAQEEASLNEVMPEGKDFLAVKPAAEILYYKVKDKEGKFIGVVFKTQAKGYSSNIETLAGMDKDGVIQAIKILQQNETPGLGAQITEPSFTSQFKNKDIARLKEVEAITGATISSQAVIAAVKKKAEEIKGLIKNEK